MRSERSLKMLIADELEKFRHALGNDFPMFSEWEKGKIMGIAMYGTSDLVRALTYLAEAYLQAETAEGAVQASACSEQM